MPVYSFDGITPEITDPARCFVAPGAHVMGRVRLKLDASIWFNAVLRGDNEWIEIGEGSNVQENCVLHTDMGFPMHIGKSCTIGHSVVLHGCTISDGALIGMGATVLNGAKIGRNCLVGANALVTEGKDFPDNSLIVGSPARAVRTLDPQQAQMGSRTAQFYVLRSQQFMKTLIATG